MAEATVGQSGGVAEACTPAAARWEANQALQRRLVALAVLGEADTLELLLERCTPGPADPAAAAEALLHRFGGVGRVVGAPRAELAAVVGEGLADEIAVLHALLLRVLDHPLRRRDVLSSTSAAMAYLRARLGALPREAFHVLFLDRRNQLIADECLGQGSISHAPVYPREVVRRALELSSSAILLAHNHPSGNPSPSSADVEMTRLIASAGRPLDIAVHDHMIVAGGQVVSFKALGLL